MTRPSVGARFASVGLEFHRAHGCFRHGIFAGAFNSIDGTARVLFRVLNMGYMGMTF
jgi:hypothetical protein